MSKLNDTEIKQEDNSLLERITSLENTVIRISKEMLDSKPSMAIVHTIINQMVEQVSDL